MLSSLPKVTNSFTKDELVRLQSVILPSFLQPSSDALHTACDDDNTSFEVFKPVEKDEYIHEPSYDADLPGAIPFPYGINGIGYGMYQQESTSSAPAPSSIINEDVSEWPIQQVVTANGPQQESTSSKPVFVEFVPPFVHAREVAPLVQCAGDDVYPSTPTTPFSPNSVVSVDSLDYQLPDGNDGTSDNVPFTAIATATTGVPCGHTQELSQVVDTFVATGDAPLSMVVTVDELAAPEPQPELVPLPVVAAAAVAPTPSPGAMTVLPSMMTMVTLPAIPAPITKSMTSTMVLPEPDASVDAVDCECNENVGGIEHDLLLAASLPLPLAHDMSFGDHMTMTTTATATKGMTMTGVMKESKTMSSSLVPVAVSHHDSKNGGTKRKQSVSMTAMVPSSSGGNDKRRRVEVVPVVSSSFAVSDDETSSVVSSDGEVETKQVKGKGSRGANGGKGNGKAKTNKSKLPTKERTGWGARVTSGMKNDPRSARVLRTADGTRYVTGSDVTAVLSNKPCETKEEKKAAALNTTRLMNHVSVENKCISNIGNQQHDITPSSAPLPWWHDDAGVMAIGNTYTLGANTATTNGNGRRLTSRQIKKVSGGRGQGATMINAHGLLQIIDKKKKKDTHAACTWLRNNILPILQVTDNDMSPSSVSVRSGSPLFGDMSSPSPSSPSSSVSSNDESVSSPTPWM